MLWNLPKQKEILFLKDQEATAHQSTETWSVTQMDRNFSRYVSYDARGCWNVVLCIPAKPWPSGFLSWRVGHVEGCGSLVLKKQNTRAESCWVEAFGECVRALQSRSEVFQCEASLLIFIVSRLWMLAGKRVLQVLQQIITRDYSLSHKSELAKQPFYIHKYYPSVYFAVCTYNFFYFIGQTFGFWHCIINIVYLMEVQMINIFI